MTMFRKNYNACLQGELTTKELAPKNKWEMFKRYLEAFGLITAIQYTFIIKD